MLRRFEFHPAAARLSDDWQFQNAVLGLDVEAHPLGRRPGHGPIGGGYCKPQGVPLWYHLRDGLEPDPDIVEIAANKRSGRGMAPPMRQIEKPEADER